MQYELNFNQLSNTKNPYQGKATKALCVCSAGLLRSPTIAKVLTEKGYNTRAAGASQEYALIPLSPALILWADEIHVVKEQAEIVKKAVDSVLEDVGDYIKSDRPSIHVYDIPDCYGTFDKDLEELIRSIYEED